MMKKFFGLAILGIATLASAANGATITQWNFNSTPSDGSSSTGTLAPSTGTGTASLIGGVTNTFATGSPGDPTAIDNTGLNTTTYPAASVGSGTAGVKYAASTVGYSDIVISQDFRTSATASYYWQLLVSSDGTTFSAPSGGIAAFGSAPSPNSATAFSNTGLYENNSGSGSQQFVQSISYTLPSGSVYENNPNFAYEWVSVFAPSTTSYTGANPAGAGYATGGTARFDMATISGTTIVPEPSTMVLGALGLVGVIGFGMRSCRNS